MRNAGGSVLTCWPGGAQALAAAGDKGVHRAWVGPCVGRLLPGPCTCTHTAALASLFHSIEGSTCVYSLVKSSTRVDSKAQRGVARRGNGCCIGARRPRATGPRGHARRHARGWGGEADWDPTWRASTGRRAHQARAAATQQRTPPPQLPQRAPRPLRRLSCRRCSPAPPLRLARAADGCAGGLLDVYRVTRHPAPPRRRGAGGRGSYARHICTRGQLKARGYGAWLAAGGGLLARARPRGVPRHATAVLILPPALPRPAPPGPAPPRAAPRPAAAAPAGGRAHQVSVLRLTQRLALEDDRKPER